MTKLATENNIASSSESLIGTKWEAASGQQWNLKPFIPVTPENYKIVPGCEFSHMVLINYQCWGDYYLQLKIHRAETEVCW